VNHAANVTAAADAHRLAAHRLDRATNIRREAERVATLAGQRFETARRELAYAERCATVDAIAEADALRRRNAARSALEAARSASAANVRRLEKKPE
jgi:hypothetical protein